MHAGARALEPARKPAQHAGGFSKDRWLDTIDRARPPGLTPGGQTQHSSAQRAQHGAKQRPTAAAGGLARSSEADSPTPGMGCSCPSTAAPAVHRASTSCAPTAHCCGEQSTRAHGARCWAQQARAGLGVRALTGRPRTGRQGPYAPRPSAGGLSTRVLTHTCVRARSAGLDPPRQPHPPWTSPGDVTCVPGATTCSPHLVSDCLSYAAHQCPDLDLCRARDRLVLTMPPQPPHRRRDLQPQPRSWSLQLSTDTCSR
jgi:hypothetical protein